VNWEGKMSPKQPELIVALDNCTPNEAEQLATELAGAQVRWLKVGLELYTQAGPALVREFKKRGFNVFLDLKLHDIPNTVAKAVAAAGEIGADLLTVHCSGGPAMLEAAQKAAAQSKLSLLGVTVLTSIGADDLSALARVWGVQSIAPNRNEVAKNLAELAERAGLAGIVCSVPDLKAGLKKVAQARSLYFVTPGIRGSNDASNDQKSVATVEEAVAAGSTHLVVGRPITSKAPGERAQAAATFLAMAAHAAALTQ